MSLWIGTVASSSGNKFYSNNMVLYLDASDTSSYPGSGSTWYDISSSSNHISLSNSPSFNSGNGGHFIFNGSSNFIYRSTFSNFNSSNFSLFAWVNPSSVSSGWWGQLSRSSSDANTEWMIGFSSSTVLFWDYDNGYGYTNVTMSGSVSTGSWQYLGFTKNGTSGKFYKNGVLTNSVSASKNASYGTNDFAIGKDYRDNINFFNGKLAQYHIWSETLDDATILKNFNATRSPYGV